MSSPPPGPEYSWQPQPGDYKSAPTYGQPPRKSRAGLIIALILVFVLVALGAIGVLAFRLVNRTSDPEPGSAAAPPSAASHSPAVTSHTPATTSRPTANTRPTAGSRPTAAPKPTTARPNTTAGPATGASAVTDLARRFVTQLNANNPTTAATLACESSRQLIPTLMRTFLTPPTKLTPGQPIGQSPTYVIPLTGTTKNMTVTGALVIHQIAPEPLCIRAFQLSPR
ncbi:hypothetical protein [Kribbella sp. NPDC003557]|uniref:hypothetical protein n=1 Tax=Kribbella sp. NPDC003557 TaxID=3154449 RepID=UPI0033ABFF94